jgi:hypothetical protein
VHTVRRIAVGEKYRASVIVTASTLIDVLATGRWMICSRPTWHRWSLRPAVLLIGSGPRQHPDRAVLAALYAARIDSKSWTPARHAEPTTCWSPRSRFAAALMLKRWPA